MRVLHTFRYKEKEVGPGESDFFWHYWAATLGKHRIKPLPFKAYHSHFLSAGWKESQVDPELRAPTHRTLGRLTYIQSLPGAVSK